MKSFAFYSPTTLDEAVHLLQRDPARTQLLAGGMDLLGRIKRHIDTPNNLINLKMVPGLDSIKKTAQGLSIGPLVKLADLADDDTVRTHYAALAEAAESVGSVQIRNGGTVGGNLCQRPRCWYFRHPDFTCLQKEGEVCYAQGGENRYHAILGGGPCFFAHPSDVAPALVVLDAQARIAGPRGERTVSVEKLYRLPAEQLGYGLAMEPDEILAEILVPSPPPGTRSTYHKLKEKPSFDFALAGVAAAITADGGKVTRARIALSGVAPIPWRAEYAEKLLPGIALDEALARRVAEAVVADNNPLAQNGYKVALTKTVVRRTLMTLA
jgi:xanthine dehydrogenase YagS FAD-binding subunit